MHAKVTATGLALGIVLGLALPGPAGAGAGFTIRIGSGTDAPSSPPGATPRATTPWVVAPPDKEGRPHDRRDRDWRRKRYHHRSPYLGHYGGTYYAAPAPVPPPVAEAPPEAVAPPEPAPPPDPRGPLFLSPARGAAAAVGAEDWQVGEALPAGVPQVTLDWRSYGLPEPPPGRVYARVGRTVLLITASGRVVEGVLPPG